MAVSQKLISESGNPDDPKTFSRTMQSRARHPSPTRYGSTGGRRPPLGYATIWRRL
jgi:hypothetical protein